MLAKKIAAEKSVELISDGMVVGLGTGSTAEFAIRKLADRVREGLQVTAVPTSLQTEKLARQLGIPIADLNSHTSIDLCVDGADEVDKHNNLIKGGGGSLLREKFVAYHSKAFYVVVDESKCVDTLGAFPLPVEIIPFGAGLTRKKVEALGCTATIRRDGAEEFVTDNGNLIVDCSFGRITDPRSVDSELRTIPGVVETGLFFHVMVSAIFVGRKHGTVRTRTNK